MKKKIAIFAFLTLGLFTSCSKDDDSSNTNTVLTNAYTYGDTKHDIKWAGYYYEEGRGYVFAVAPKIPSNINNLYDETDYFAIDLPLEKLNLKNNLSDNLDGSNWYFYASFMNNGDYYSINDQQSDNDNDEVTGTNNWVKVTKNTGDNNFTIEFEMTINGKLLKGTCTANFTKVEDYITAT